MNKNCLQGFKCPKCQHEDSFRIEIATTALMEDDGTADFGDIEWEDHSSCQCEDCGFAGTVSEFRGGKPAKDPKVKALESFCETVEITGGLTPKGDPVADRDWGDLGDAYLEACKALGRKPMRESPRGR